MPEALAIVNGMAPWGTEFLLIVRKAETLIVARLEDVMEAISNSKGTRWQETDIGYGVPSEFCSAFAYRTLLLWRFDQNGFLSQSG